jgi:PTS system galactitol-specific IIC component
MKGEFMDFIMSIFDYIQGLGATVMMPIIICIFGLVLGAGFGKSLRAGLTVGVGFIGLNLVTGLMGSSLGTAVQLMSERFGLSLGIVDVGWPSAAAIAFGSAVGKYIIPIGLIVNILMILTTTTQTIDVDIWDYWHFAFTGALVNELTGSIVYGIIAAVSNMVIIMVLGDWTAKGVEDTLGLPGVSLPHGFSTAYAPVAIGLNALIDKIPGLNKISFSIESLQQKLGVFGEPILIGTVMGLVIGILAGYDVKGVLGLAVNLGAVLVLIPRMAALLMEGLLPVSDAAGDFVQKHFSNRGKIYIGLDSAVGVGHPMSLTVALILVPLSIFLAVILPGNRTLPFADLSVYPWMFVLITPVVKGNGFRALLIGLVCVIGGLYISTYLSQFMTPAAVKAEFDMGTAKEITSICDGANPLTFLFVILSSLTPIVGAAVPAVIAIALAIINRNRILKGEE